MIEELKPLVSESLKDVFVSKFESLILSGKFSSGDVLPSERDLSVQLKVSRPVVHEGLIELAARGLVSLKPRSRAVVNDLKKEGSLALLSSLMNFHGNNLAPQIQKSILDLRLLFEVENAGLAAQNITLKQLQEFLQCLNQEENMLNHLDNYPAEEIAELDFRVHHLMAEASGNFIYPLLLNSFKPVYVKLSAKFFSDKPLIKKVFAYHKELYLAIQEKQAKQAQKIMTKILHHGALELERIINQEK